MQALMQAVQNSSGANSAQVQDLDSAEDEDADDDDFAAGAPAARNPSRQSRSLPTSDLMPHIPRRSIAWWDNHPSGTPIAYKDLPGQLRQAMDKNPRDRLEVQLTFTALSLAASLLDTFAVVTVAPYAAQLGIKLLLSHLCPLLARRVDALQQEGSLRSVFQTAQDPRSQYFITDPDTSYGILQKVSSARVQALMTAAGRRDDGSHRSPNSNNNNNGKQRQGAAGSPQQRTRDRCNANNRNNGNASCSSQRSGSRDRGDRSRERNGSRDGAASRSNPADSSSRGGDRN